MGADFIGGFCPIRKTREEALIALSVLDNEALLEAVEYSYFPSAWDETEDMDDKQFVEFVRDLAEKAVNEVFDALEYEARDCGVWTIEGTNYIVTGGMSWGDTPTDMCAPIWCVDNLGVTK